MNYSEPIGRALRLTFKHRALWIMGFIVGLNSMAVGLFGGGGQAPRRPGDVFQGSEPRPSNPPPLLELWERLEERPELRSLLLAVLCAAVVLAVVVFILSVIGRGGLIGGALRAEANGNVTFGEMWGIGLYYFWRMLTVRSMLIAPFVAFFIATGCLFVPLVFVPLLGLVCLPPLVCGGGVFLLVASLVSTLAERGIVLDDLGPFDAYRQGWELLRAKAGQMLAFILTMMALRLALGFVVAMLVGVMALPAIAGLYPDNPNWLLVGGSVLLSLCLFPLAAWINSLTTAWDVSAWTFAYRQFTGNRPADIVSPYELA